MGTSEADSKLKHEMDDSGCVQDGSPKKTVMQNVYVGQVEMLDLSDDVLLFILKYLSAHDLKALGFTCSRLSTLVLDRSLWTRVDTRGEQYGRHRTKWLLQALHDGTKELLLTGLAGMAQGCLGHVNRTRKEVEEANAARKRRRGEVGAGDVDHLSVEELLAITDPLEQRLEQHPIVVGGRMEPPYPLMRQHSRLHMDAHPLPRRSGAPAWPDEYDRDCQCGPAAHTQGAEPCGCAGPLFTLSPYTLRALRQTCPKLVALSLDHCNINCNKTSIVDFPPTLTRLSLRGSKCYNLPLDKSFLFKIHDHLPLLEHLDLSDCEWLEPAALLPLSKLPALRALLLRACPGLEEFVAYISLATRYGFRTLQELDFSGSPVGDSEVSALGWLPELRVLRLAAPPRAPPSTAHAHYSGDRVPSRTDLVPWETQEPEYFKQRHSLEPVSCDIPSEDVEDQVDQLREHFQQSTDMISIEVHAGPREFPRPGHTIRSPLKRRHSCSNTNEVDPSKRRKPNQGCKDCQERENEDRQSDKDRHSAKQASDDASEAGPSKWIKVDTESDDNSDIEAKRVKTSDKSAKRDSDDISEASPCSSKSEYPNTSARSGDSDESTWKRSKRDTTGDVDSCDSDVDRISAEPDQAHSRESIRTEPKIMPECNGADSPEELHRDAVDPRYSPRERITNRSNNNDSLNGNEDHNGHEDRNGNRFERRFDINVGASTSYSISVSVTNDLDQQQPKNEAKESDSDSKKADKTKRKDEKQPSSGSEAGSYQGSTPIRLRSHNCSQTSSQSSSPSSSNGGPSPQEPSHRCEQYLRFRHNQEPVVIPCPRNECPDPEPLSHHVLYVNVGQRLHAVYRLLPNRPFFDSVRNRYASTSAERLASSSLVTDSAIRRFGRADGEYVNVVNIGPNGPQVRETERPDRSNLRVIVATGYRSITNRSLMHLATAAPHLEMVDFTNTGVTDAGVESFKTVRPDCKVKFSTFQEEMPEE